MTTKPDSKPPGEYYCPSCERTFPPGDRCPSDGARLVRLSARKDPFLGRDLDGRFTIIEKIGEGGMGAVYRGSQHSVDREVAIKLVNSQLVYEPDVIKRFLREAKLASRLSHPNAVAVLDFGQTDDGVFYLVMELVTGRTLDEVIRTERVLGPERVVRIGAQVCDALEGAHALQIVHRDLKPANIMVLSRGRDLIKVLDFGLAKSVAPDRTSTTMTNAGAMLGTPAFMPPELALGQSCDGRADLYSLGCILFLAGCGRLPFVSDSAHELIAMHGHEPAPPMVGVPAPLAAVVDRLLEKDPAKRFQSAAETREALEAALDRNTPMPDTEISYRPPAMTVVPTYASAPARSLTPIGAAARGAAELDPMVTSAPTIAPTVRDTDMDQAVRPRQRWVLPLAALGALAVGGVVFAIVRSADDDAAAPAPERTAPAPTPAATPTPAPPPPPPPAPAPPPSAVVVTPIDAGTAAAAPAPPPAVVPEHKKSKPVHLKTVKPTAPAPEVEPPKPPPEPDSKLPF